MWLRYSRERALKSSKVRAIGNLNLNFKFLNRLNRLFAAQPTVEARGRHPRPGLRGRGPRGRRRSRGPRPPRGGRRGRHRGAHRYLKSSLVREQSAIW